MPFLIILRRGPYPKRKKKVYNRLIAFICSALKYLDYCMLACVLIMCTVIKEYVSEVYRAPSTNLLFLGYKIINKDSDSGFTRVASEMSPC